MNENKSSVKVESKNVMSQKIGIEKEMKIDGRTK